MLRKMTANGSMDESNIVLRSRAKLGYRVISNLPVTVRQTVLSVLDCFAEPSFSQSECYGKSQKILNLTAYVVYSHQDRRIRIPRDLVELSSTKSSRMLEKDKSPVL